MLYVQEWYVWSDRSLLDEVEINPTNRFILLHVILNKSEGICERNKLKSEHSHNLYNYKVLFLLQKNCRSKRAVEIIFLVFHKNINKE